MSGATIFDITLNVVDGSMRVMEKPVPTIFENRAAELYTGNFLQCIAAASLSGNDRLTICRNLYRIVTELHKLGMLHGSICAGNVVCDNNTISLTNAGLFVAIQRSLAHVPLLPCTSYRPREELLRDDYAPSKSSDMYALTILFYTVFSGRDPYSEIHASQRVIRIIRNGHLGLIKPHSMPLNLWNALLAFWNADPKNRPLLFNQILAALF